MKNIRKTLRFSEPEFEEISKKISEHKLNFSDFARCAILQKNIETKLTLDLIFQIQKIGNNLNQIAKTLNSEKSDIPNSEILKQLIIISEKLEDLKC